MLGARAPGLALVLLAPALPLGLVATAPSGAAPLLLEVAAAAGAGAAGAADVLRRGALASLRAAAMTGGVTMLAPDTVHLCHDTKLGADVVLEPNIFIGPDVSVEDGVTIRAFSHLEGCVVKRGAVIGPYARLRPGTVIEPHAHVGNFVELKATTLGPGAKANHLSYLGDATIGAGANIGAGTITCNYDGVAKHRTEIGEGAFIGSDTALVAPVKIGARALVAAGSVITEDVPDDALAIARGRQAVKPGRGFKGKGKR